MKGAIFVKGLLVLFFALAVSFMLGSYLAMDAPEPDKTDDGTDGTQD